MQLIIPSSGLRVPLLIMFTMIVALAAPTIALAFEREDPGQPVVDDAGVLSQSDIERIEQAVLRVEEAGAVAVVYLQLADRSTSDTISDSRELLEEWDVQSGPGTRDGVVMFFNLEPDDPEHGTFALVAGESHFDGGALPQSELDRIRNEMIDVLADGRIADAIVLGLERLEARLLAGPPEPPAFEAWAREFASGPVSWLNILSAAGAVALSLILAQAWGARPRAEQRWQDQTTTPPSTLLPAYVGAVTSGSISDALIEATLLDLAQRGHLAIEPVTGTKDKVRIHLLHPPEQAAPFETTLWDVLEEGAADGVIQPDDIQYVYADLERVRRSLIDDLVARGWFDANTGRKRFPMIAVAVLAFVLAIATIVVVAASGEPWGIAGVIAFGVIGIVGIVLATHFRNTTVEGERVANQWRGYEEGLRSSRNAPYGAVDLDTAFPYLVALGLAAEFEPYLKSASEAGYVPGWLRRRDGEAVVHAHWIPYWVVLHSTMAPSTSPGVTTTGGASIGSGASGGRF